MSPSPTGTSDLEGPAAQPANPTWPNSICFQWALLLPEAHQKGRKRVLDFPRKEKASLKKGNL